MKPWITLAACALLAQASFVAPTGAQARAPGAAAARAAIFAEPSLSPDGRELAFVSAGDIWVAPAAGGDARLVVGHTANDFRPRWSPDGSKLAFVSTRSGNGDIYVLEVAGGALTRLTFEDGQEQLDAWSPDGRFIYFSTAAHDIAGMNDVFRVKATGGTPMPVAADRYASEYWAAPSPDGRRLAITARGVTAGQWWRRGSSHIDEAEIWTVTLDGTPRYERISTGERPGKGRDAWPMWAPDGRTLWFVSDRDSVENIYAQAPGAPARALTRFTDGRVLWPQAARDGSRIVFERDFRIWSLDVATGAAAPVPLTLRGAPTAPVAEHRSITTGIQEFSLSPDGKKVAYVVRGEVFAADAKAGGEGTRVTTTVEPEGMPEWAPDSRRLAYSSWRDGKARIHVHDFATRTDRALTAGGDDINARWSPDGKSIAFVRGGSELRIVDATTGAERLVARGVQLGNVPFVPDRNVAWSPDGKHLAYLSVGDRGFLNAHVVPADGGEGQQVSFLANAFGGTIAWSSDQRSLFFDNAQRTEDGQLIRVDLVPRAPRFREARFESLFPSDSVTSRDTAAARTRGTTPQAAANAREARENPVRIDRDGLRRRASALPVNVSAGGVAMSPDGKTLAFVANAAGQTQVWTWSVDEAATEPPQARQVTSSPGGKGNLQWSGDSKELWFTSGGRVQAIGVDSRQLRTINLSASLDVDFRAEAGEVFRQVWSWTRDNFYDPAFHGVDWEAVRTRYEPVVAATRTPDEMRRVLGLMVGELNASHSGVGGPAAQPPSAAKLGLEFDRARYERDGRLVVSHVIAHGAAALAGGIREGDVVQAIDGVAITPSTNLDSLLSNRAGDRVPLRVAGGNGVARTVDVMPTSTNAEKAALYREWVDSRRAYVERVSGGRLGYVHMQDMGAGSLAQLYVDLDAENHGKDGIVIDIRNNNGGFVNAYALDVFSRRPYMTMERRATVEVPARLQLGQRAFEKPTVLVTNQHSLSDAEDFTEGYRALGLGPVVGEPTSGWIIYTSNFTLFDGTTLRIPFIRIRDAEGKDMELVPRPVDVRVDRPMGEGYGTSDSQLDAAVRALLARLR